MKPVDPTHSIGFNGWIRSSAQYQKSGELHKTADDDAAAKPMVVQSIKDSVDLSSSQVRFKDSDGASFAENTPRQSSQFFSIQPVGKVSGGTVSVTPLNASPGSVVTIAAIPEEGKKVIDISVMSKEGKTVQVTDKGNGKYAFIMPEGEATVDVSFGASQENPEQQV